jgi:hypothetical protein
MSHRIWKDTLIGFVFNSWGAIDQQLTGKECPDDSGAVEKYADALGLKLTILGEAAIFSLSDADLPWEELDTGLYDSGGRSKYLSLAFFSDDRMKKLLKGLENTLTATGLTPDSGPVLVSVEEWG